MSYTKKYYKKPTKKNNQIRFINNNKNRYLVNTNSYIKNKTKSLIKQDPYMNKKKWTLKKTLNTEIKIRENVVVPMEQKKMFGGKDMAVIGNLTLENNLLTQITNQLNLIETILVMDNENSSSPLQNESTSIETQIIDRMKQDLITINKKLYEDNIDPRIEIIIKQYTLNKKSDIKPFATFLKKYYKTLKGYIIVNNLNDNQYILKDSELKT